MAGKGGTGGKAGGKGRVPAAKPGAERDRRLPRNVYETELYRLQGELMKVQEWVRSDRARIVVIFEGRDAAGKGGTIQQIGRASCRERV